MSLLKMYQRAVKLYVGNGSAVVEDDSATEAEEAEERPGERFKYNTPRKGKQHLDTQYRAARACARRRFTAGGGAGIGTPSLSEKC